ncbi:MAG: ABC transporter permease [Pseudobdellovibrio sp.]
MIQVWRRNFLFFKKTFAISFLWTILEPLMYLTAIGFGLGRFVEQIEGLPFIEFYYPGLLASTAMTISYFESTYPNYTKLMYQKTYSMMLLTPLTEKKILLGEILWSATKGFIGVCGVCFVSLFFGLFKPQILLTLPFLFLVCLVFAAFGMIMISIARSYDSFIISTSGFIIPMSLLSGTYFSIKEMPVFFRGLSNFLPLTHGVNLTRDILYRTLSISSLIDTAVLIVYAVVLSIVAYRLFKKKLVQ